MDKDELINLLKEHIEYEEPFQINPEDAKKILMTDVPEGMELEVSVIGKDNVHYIALEGTIGWKDKKACVFMSLDWYRKWWHSPLGMPFHMDLMKRLIEFRQKENKDIEEIEFEDEGDWCHLTYLIFPKTFQTVFDVYNYALEIDKWIIEIVGDAQEKVGQLHLQISKEFSKFKLIETPSLLRKIETEKDSNEKGRLLEEFVSRIFSQITGFEIIERVKTETEEIDIVILNKSIETFWQKESPIIMVECKNWSEKCGKNELVIFKEKLLNRRGRAKIGFFISWNGFKDTFKKEDLRTSQEDILIIPVSGDELKEAINKNNLQKSLEEFWLNALKV